MEYQLTQTGAEVQNILDQAPTTEQNLQSEITRSTEKDQELETAISNEKTRAEGVEGPLVTAVGNLETDVESIKGVIPAQATPLNKLVDKNYVDDAIATNTADFKGTYPSLEALITAVPEANANDYAFVVTTDQDGNVTYSRYKYVEGTGWTFEYALNNSSFTAAQWAAINSGITAALVAKLAGLPNADALVTQMNALIAVEKNRAEAAEGTLTNGLNAEILARQNADTALQQNINAEALLRDNADDALQAEIDGIDAKIPTQASASNQLADKAFVNSSISTNTSEFKGTYNSLAELQQVTNANANDYAFVITTDSDGNKVYNRYKYVEGQGWVFEYALNNSSFTAAQWGAINSGITAALAAKINGLPDIDALNAMFASITSKIPADASSSNKLVDYAQLVADLSTKQDTLIFDNVPVENSNNPVKSGGVYNRLYELTVAIVGLQHSKQDVLTFDQYPTPGSDNPVRSGGINTWVGNMLEPVKIRVSTNEADIAMLQAAYRALTESDVVVVAPTDTWPVANPELNTIYRVADRAHTPPQNYSDYMYNGTAMVLMATYDNAIDPRPKKNSQNLVTSGGVFDNMGALDVSELNATENPHTLAKYVDLSDALAAIPTDYRKGGMSVKYVQSSDNKYIRHNLLADSFTTDTTQWAIDDAGVYVESSEFVKVYTDKKGRILWAIKVDGSIYYGAGVPQQVIDYINYNLTTLLAGKVDKETGKSLIDAEYADGISYIENSEFVAIYLDHDYRILFGIKTDGDFLFGCGVPQQIIDYINSHIAEILAEMQIDLEAKVDKVAGKGLIQNDVAESLSFVEDPEERSEVTTDSEKRVIYYREKNGILHENVGIETNSLILTDEGMTAFQQALKDSGFTSGKGNWSDYISNDGDNPLHLSIPRCAIINITNSRNNAVWPTSKTNDYEYYIEYADVEGNYFKKPIIANAQGNSSMGMPKKNMALDMFDSEWNGDAFSVKFGHWVPQDSFQLKAFYLDLFRCVCPISYKLARQIVKTRGPIDDAFWKREMLPAIGTGTTAMSGFDDYNKIYDDGAIGIPDGFPCIVFLNGDFYGVYSFQLKKHRDNYMMSKGNAGHIHLDGCIKDIFEYNGTINWAVVAGTVADSMGNRDGIEFRNPKNLVYAEAHSGTYKYDADSPGQFEIAGNNDGSAVYDTWQAGSYAVGKIVSHNGHIYMNTVADNTAEPIYHAKNNADDAPDFKNKTGCGWLNVTNTVAVKSSFIALSTYVPELAQMVEDQSTDEQIRTKIEQHFDVKGLIDYMLLSVVAGYETAGKNWQWITYDGVKWSVCPWDYDGAFGWDGWGEVSPTANISVNTTSLNTPLGWIYNYFNTEVKQRYEELRDKKVIELQSIWSMFEKWLNAVGADNYGKDLDKWPCDKDHYSGMSVYHYDNKYRLYNWIAARIEKCDTIFEYNS